MAGKNKNTKKNKTALETGRVATNRRARYDYEIIETLEAGLVLTGTEVKSLRMGTISLSDAYAGPKNGELYLFNVHIGEYPHAHIKQQHEPKRPRKVLVHKKELARLLGAVTRDGMTLVPMSLYFNDRGILKLSLGLAKGKKTVDKRDSIKKRDWERRKGSIMRELG
ncbi:SsrA-binding protein SmpB [Aestuariispira insulae]|uniref:SsrA-binding protein n=1 Tax=Aestuariispira insulae TaxID=1461337 RepID=A0A3D9HVA1_9PROT|nr:SsrA-binding protein SmpB [Aestuariispira insulae]RED53454.1 SsrA-binding protein [Aestuariispira insulae]